MAFGFTATAGTISGTHSGFVGYFSTTNFPSGSLSGANAILNGGGNLRAYTDSTKATALPLEIVTLVTGVSAEAQVWVRLSSLSTAGTVYLEADDTETTQPAVTAPLGRNAVWAGDKHVIHCESTNTIDSTGNGGIPTLVGGITNSQLTNGLSALDFDGNMNTRLHLGNTGSVLGDFESFAWVNVDAGGSLQSIVARRNDASGGAWEFQWRLESLDPAILIGSTSPNDPAAPISTSTDYLLGVQVSGSTINFFRDGVLTGSQSVSGSRVSRNVEFSVGGIVSNSTGRSINGRISTVMFRESANTTADRAITEYDNQNSPSTFWSSSAWEDQAGGITVTGNTASYGYNGVSGTVELTGEIVVTGSTASYGYNGVNGEVDLTSEILITGQTASYGYDGVSGSVDLSGLISITGQTASYDYDGVSGEVILQGTIVVTGDTANYAYNALNGTIIIQGPITVNPRNVITVKRKSNDIIVSRKSNTVRVK